MTETTSSTSRVPAGVPTGGQFAASARTEADVALSTIKPGQEDDVRIRPLTPNDVETLRDSKGALANVHDDDDIVRVVAHFESAHLMGVWETYDDYDHSYQGDHQVIGQFITDPDSPAVDQTWRRLHPDVWLHLYEPDADVDVTLIPSLLDTESHQAVYERQDIDDMPGAMQHSVAFANLGETTTCALTDCDEVVDETGYWGYCGRHATLIEDHRMNYHAEWQTPGPSADCPECG